MKYVLKIAFIKLYQTIFYLFKIDKILTLIETYHHFGSNVKMFGYLHLIWAVDNEGGIWVSEAIMLVYFCYGLL